MTSVESMQGDHERFPFLKSPYTVKVCRIEPENNVHMVLEAFARMKNENLVIVGNWKNSAYGKSLVSKYGGYNNIFLLDPIYDQRLIDLLRGSAKLYIHGHSAGGTNPSLVEAMNLKLPVLTFDVSYNKTTTEGKASYFKTAEDIELFMRKSSMEKLRENTFAMKEIADRRYQWKIIAFKYNALIQEVLQLDGKKALILSTSAKLSKPVLIQYQAAHLQNQFTFYEKR